MSEEIQRMLLEEETETTPEDGNENDDVFVMDQSIIDKLNEAVKQDKVAGR